MKSFAEYMLGQLDIQLPAGICKYTEYVFYLRSRVVAEKIKVKKQWWKLRCLFSLARRLIFTHRHMSS